MVLITLTADRLVSVPVELLCQYQVTPLGGPTIDLVKTVLPQLLAMLGTGGTGGLAVMV